MTEEVEYFEDRVALMEYNINLSEKEAEKVLEEMKKKYKATLQR